jgi:cytochrome c oxidase assembly protein subunit 15
VARLKVEVATLAHLHESLLIAFLGLLAGLAFGLAAVRAAKPVTRRLVVVIALSLGQGLIGVVQYFTGVPAVLVTLHVAGAVLVTAATAALWASLRERAEPEPL